MMKFKQRLSNRRLQVNKDDEDNYSDTGSYYKLLATDNNVTIYDTVGGGGEPSSPNNSVSSADVPCIRSEWLKTRLEQDRISQQQLMLQRLKRHQERQRRFEEQYRRMEEERHQRQHEKKKKTKKVIPPPPPMLQTPTCELLKWRSASQEKADKIMRRRSRRRLSNTTTLPPPPPAAVQKPNAVRSLLRLVKNKTKSLSKRTRFAKSKKSNDSNTALTLNMTNSNGSTNNNNKNNYNNSSNNFSSNNSITNNSITSNSIANSSLNTNDKKISNENNSMVNSENNDIALLLTFALQKSPSNVSAISSVVDTNNGDDESGSIVVGKDIDFNEWQDGGSSDSFYSTYGDEDEEKREEEEESEDLIAEERPIIKSCLKVATQEESLERPFISRSHYNKHVVDTKKQEIFKMVYDLDKVDSGTKDDPLFNEIKTISSKNASASDLFIDNNSTSDKIDFEHVAKAKAAIANLTSTVAFSESLHVYEFPYVLDDNPSVSSGVAVGSAWDLRNMFTTTHEELQEQKERDHERLALEHGLAKWKLDDYRSAITVAPKHNNNNSSTTQKQEGFRSSWRRESKDDNGDDPLAHLLHAHKLSVAYRKHVLLAEGYTQKAIDKAFTRAQHERIARNERIQKYYIECYNDGLPFIDGDDDDDDDDTEDSDDYSDEEQHRRKLFRFKRQNSFDQKYQAPQWIKYFQHLSMKRKQKRLSLGDDYELDSLDTRQ